MAEEIKLLPESVWLKARAGALLRHSPVQGLRGLPPEPQQTLYGTGAALRFGQRPGEFVLPMHGAAAGQWLVQRLAWDSDYFGTPTFRLFTALFGTETTPVALSAAAGQLRAELASRGPFYAFSVVPAEDLALLQALTGGGWRLIETRLNFYCPVAEARLPAPAPVRLARPDEATAIGQIAATNRNPYDRFHADPWFGPARADAFLACYAEAAVAGTAATAVLLPDAPGLPMDSFLTLADTADLPGLPDSRHSRLQLAAVGPANRGWFLKLQAAAVRRAADLSLPHVLMTTQAANGAALRNCETLGFRLGGVSHVLACHDG